jgi:methionine-rich copper-binding protein CopC
VIRRLWTRAAVVVGLATALALPASTAQAHDVLESTNPANGSTVASVPASIVLTYDHTPIAIGTEILVKDATGANQADGPAQVVDNNVSQAIKPGAPAGTYTVVWRVVSSDSHPIEGTFTFTATAAGSGSQSAAAPAASPTASAPASQGSGADVPVWAIVVGILVLAAIVALGYFVRRALRVTSDS